MSRIKVFTTLFLTLIVGTVASIFLYQQWLLQYQDKVLKPVAVQNAAASKAAIELFAYQKLQAATRHVLGAKKLLSSFGKGDAKARHDAAFDELNALKAKAGLKGAAFAVAADHKGMVFANSSSVNFKADWSGWPAVSKALTGEATHGVAPYKKKPHIIVAVPISGTPTAGSATDQDKGDDDGGDKPNDRRDPPKKRSAKKSAKKGKCKPGKYWYCFAKCVKRGKKKKGQRYGKCLERSKTKKTCYCRKGKKTGALTPAPRKTRLAQKAPDKRAKADDADEPGDNSSAGKDKLGQSKTTGVVVLGFALDKSLAAALKKHTGLDVVFFNKSGTLGGTLASDAMGKVGKMLNGKSQASVAMASRKGDQPFTVSFGDKNAFAGVSAPLGSAKDTGVLMLQSMNATNEMFWQYNMFVAAVGGGAFLLALFMLLLAAGSFRKQLHQLEEKVLETYETGDLNVALNEKATKPIGSLAATLNRLFERFQQQSLAASEASEAIARQRRELEERLSAPQPTAASLPTQEASMVEESAESSEPSTADMISHFLENPDAHYLEVYNQYRDAKEQCGEDTSKLKKDKFIEKLRKNAASYASKYDCKGVLFDVTIKDNKVILKPQLIPKD